MTLGGWLFLVVSWALIITLCTFCVVKVLLARRDNIHAPLEIDTGDVPVPREPKQ